jgi:hypothetical protein
VGAGAWAIGQFVMALLLAAVLSVPLALLLLLGLLPIPYIRTLVLAAQSRLTATVGDSLAFVESPIRAAFIRACILDGLARLRQLCKHTVIVAHSQGAAAVLDTLGGIAERDEEYEVEAASGLVPDALVTFGAGTNQLASQKVLAAGLPETFGTNPPFRVVLAILATVLTGLALFVGTRLLQPTLLDHLWAILAVFLPPIVTVLMFLLIERIKDDERRNRILNRWAKLIFFFVLLLVVLYAVLCNNIFWFWSTFLAALSVFTQYLSLSSEMEKIVTNVRRPLGLARWDDLYASADPVPNGPTRTTGNSPPATKMIWNLGSVFADHTAYWDNRDGFVLRVARVCAETAQSPWTSELPSDSDFVDKRAAWRVRFLHIGWWSNFLAWLGLGLLLWIFWRQASVPIPFDLLRDAPVQLAALLVTFVALAMWVSTVALRWLWSWWVRKEQEAVLAHNYPKGKGGAESVLTGMMMIVWMPIVALLFSAGMPGHLSDVVAVASYIFIVLVTTFGVAGLSAKFLLKLNRPPEAPDHKSAL